LIMQNKIIAYSSKYRLFLNIVVTTLLFLMLSCATISFKKPDYPLPKAGFPKPLELVKKYRQSYAKKMTFSQKAVIELNGHKMPALGMCAFNQSEKYLALSLLTTTGIKVLEVEQKNNFIAKSFVMPDIAKKINSEKTAVAQIASDIKFIFYFPEGKPEEFSQNKSSMSVYWKKTPRKICLKFGWNSKLKRFVLKEKMLYIKNYIESVAYYYNHQVYNNKIVPMKIRYENYRFGYNLIINNTEILNDESQPAEK